MSLRDQKWWGDVQRLHEKLSQSLKLAPVAYTYTDETEFRQLMVGDLAVEWLKPSEDQTEQFFLERWCAMPSSRWQPPDGDYHIICELALDLTPDKVATIVIQHRIGQIVESELEAIGLEEYYAEMEAATQPPR